MDIEKKVLKETILKYGIGASGDNFTVIAIGNIDSDPELDVWGVNKKGEPHNVQNDRVVGSDRILLNIAGIKIYTNGIILNSSRLHLYSFIINAALWILLTFLSRRNKRMHKGCRTGAQNS